MSKEKEATQIEFLVLEKDFIKNLTKNLQSNHNTDPVSKALRVLGNELKIKSLKDTQINYEALDNLIFQSCDKSKIVGEQQFDEFKLKFSEICETSRIKDVSVPLSEKVLKADVEGLKKHIANIALREKELAY